MTAAAAPPTPAVRHRDALGVSALVLGGFGACLGLFASATWFVVLPVGLLTLIMSVIDVVRARHDAHADGRTAAVGLVAGAVALALGVWGGGMFLDELTQMSRTLSSPIQTRAPAAPVGWNQDHAFGDGVTVRVGPPVVSGSSALLTVTFRNSTSQPAWLDVCGPQTTFAGRPVTDDLSGPRPVTVAPHGAATYQVRYVLPGRTGQLRLEFVSTPGTTPGIVAGWI